MDDETFITHLVNFLPQSEYEGSLPDINDKLRKGHVELSEIEQVLEDKYQAMKHAKGWDEEEGDYVLFASPSNKKKQLKDVVGTVESFDIKQLIVPTSKVTKIRLRKRKTSTRKIRVPKGTPKAKDK